MNILCIYRAPRFSPNSVERDMAILEAVGSRLQQAGHQVVFLEEDGIKKADFKDVQAIFSMARDTQNLQFLDIRTSLCKCFPNPPQSLLRASRTYLTKEMAQFKIPQPLFVIINTDEINLPFPLWLKRGDLSAQEKGDICFVQTLEEMREALSTFSKRQVTDLLAFEHIEGDLVKFYGVAGTDFFKTYYPMEGEQFSKFGLEQHNTQIAHHTFSTSALHNATQTLASATGITIYGGDAIIRTDGTFVIIDFNDWPSFSACRDEAADAIASLINIC